MTDPNSPEQHDPSADGTVASGAEQSSERPGQTAGRLPNSPQWEQPGGPPDGSPHGQPYSQPYGQTYSQPYSQAYAQPYPPQYGQPYATGPRTNTLAIIALIAAFAVPPAGIICGHIALRQIKTTGEAGHGLALSGVIIGYVWSAIILLIIVFSILLPVLITAIFGMIAYGAM